MNTGVQTSTRQSRSDNHAIFGKFPSVYYGYALKWCHYTKWTIEEAANLLAGCVPHRPMLLPGNEHASLDQEVLEIENKIRAAAGVELEVIERRRYFGNTFIKRTDLLDWAARQDMVIPAELDKASAEARSRQGETGYSTPCLDAARWVVRTWWLNADLRDPPTSGQIIQALLQQFPRLTGEECEMIEKITRHPVAKPDELD